MRTKQKILLCSVALIAMMLLPSVAQANVYSGYQRKKLKLLWWTVQTWEMWVAIDTDVDNWHIRWKTGTCGFSMLKNPVKPNTPYMYCWMLSYVKAWDDKGFSWSWGHYSRFYCCNLNKCISPASLKWRGKHRL